VYFLWDTEQDDRGKFSVSNTHHIRLIFPFPFTACSIQFTVKVRSFVWFKCVVWKLQSGHGKIWYEGKK